MHSLVRAECRLVHLHQQSGPDLSQKFYFIITPNISSVFCAPRPQVYAPDSKYCTITMKRKLCSALLQCWAKLGSLAIHPCTTKCKVNAVSCIQPRAQTRNFCWSKSLNGPNLSSNYIYTQTNVKAYLSRRILISRMIFKELSLFGAFLKNHFKWISEGCNLITESKWMARSTLHRTGSQIQISWYWKCIDLFLADSDTDRQKKITVVGSFYIDILPSL